MYFVNPKYYKEVSIWKKELSFNVTRIEVLFKAEIVIPCSLVFWCREEVVTG